IGRKVIFPQKNINRLRRGIMDSDVMDMIGGDGGEKPDVAFVKKQITKKFCLYRENKSCRAYDEPDKIVQCHPCSLLHAELLAIELSAGSNGLSLRVRHRPDA